MGEAKKRGSYEERVAQAKERRIKEREENDRQWDLAQIERERRERERIEAMPEEERVRYVAEREATRSRHSRRSHVGSAWLAAAMLMGGIGGGRR